MALLTRVATPEALGTLRNDARSASRVRAIRAGADVIFSDRTDELPCAANTILLQVQRAALERLARRASSCRLDGSMQLYNAAFASMWERSPVSWKATSIFGRMAISGAALSCAQSVDADQGAASPSQPQGARNFRRDAPLGRQIRPVSSPATLPERRQTLIAFLEFPRIPRNVRVRAGDRAARVRSSRQSEGPISSRTSHTNAARRCRPFRATADCSAKEFPGTLNGRKKDRKKTSPLHGSQRTASQPETTLPRYRNGRRRPRPELICSDVDVSEALNEAAAMRNQIADVDLWPIPCSMCEGRIAVMPRTHASERNTSSPRLTTRCASPKGDEIIIGAPPRRRVIRSGRRYGQGIPLDERRRVRTIRFR